MPEPNMELLRCLFVFLFTFLLYDSFNSPPNCYLTPVGMQMPALFQHHAELPGKHCRRRKARTVFSDSQLSGLEKRFEIQRYLSTPERVELATALSLSETQVAYLYIHTPWKSRGNQSNNQEHLWTKRKQKRNNIWQIIGLKAICFKDV